MEKHDTESIPTPIEDLNPEFKTELRKNSQNKKQLLINSRCVPMVKPMIRNLDTLLGTVYEETNSQQHYYLKTDGIKSGKPF
ncbi:MAG: hypothetical protein GXY77_05410 [Fibrobacter sp.]|nr:hypothetical protein [Fibrobacter sp.]